MHPMLNIAIRAARKAGSIMVKKSDQLSDIKITEKADNDFVTEVDLMAEKEIFYHIQKAYPGHAILSEESGYVGNRNSDYLWIIDPIDGTNNYIHGLPHYCVSIALQVKGKIELGVIYNPSLEQLFTAAKGEGAQLNDKKIRVSTRTDFKGCLASASSTQNKSVFKDSYLEAIQDLKSSISGYRYSGSLALDLAYVGAGFVDVAWTTSSKIWDIAAAAIIIKEAGGMISEINGGLEYLTSGKLIGGNPKLVRKFANILSPHLL